MSNDTILFIVEGQVAEPQILDSLWNIFFRNTTNTIHKVRYDTNLYILWNELKDDPDLELLEVLMERNPGNRDVLEEIKNEISEVYLFFDYEGHAPEASNEDLKLMFEYFSEETDVTRGKLFISYPMVEALRHFNPEAFDFLNLTMDFDQSTQYKTRVGNECKYQDFSKFTGAMWNEICAANLIKCNQLVNELTELPTRIEDVEQNEIFDAQLNKFFNEHNQISVLSAFPLFVYYYFNNGILSRFQ